MSPVRQTQARDLVLLPEIERSAGQAFPLDCNKTQRCQLTELHIWELAVAANAQGKGAG